MKRPRVEGSLSFGNRSANCCTRTLIRRYGDGPYYVKVQAKEIGGGETEHSFVIEVASRKYLPHSVFTFLTLVKYQFYNGFQVTATPRGEDTIMTAQASPERKEAATQIRKVLGMEDTILMFEEKSTRFRCKKDSVGFDDMGSSLNWHPSAPHQRSSVACLGTVIRGTEAFAAVGAAVAAGKQIEIVQMDHLILE